MGSVGQLDLLQSACGTAWTTQAVLDEVLVPGFPEGEAVQSAIDDDWLRILSSDLDGPDLGLGRGETSWFHAVQKGDIMVIDDGVARAVARARDIPHTGLVGLLVAAVRQARISRHAARDALDLLAGSDFRMGLPLYQWALKALQDMSEGV